jgi:hypothetical protein
MRWKPPRLAPINAIGAQPGLLAQKMRGARCGLRALKSARIRSDVVDCEFFDDRIRQQFGGQFGDSNRRTRLLAAAFARLRNLNFEPLALADRDHFGEAKSVACPGDRLSLGVMDLRLQHDVDDYLGHTGRVDERARTPERAT